MSANGLGGWVGSEKWQFSLTFSTIYADGGWIRKGPKLCLWSLNPIPTRLCHSDKSYPWLVGIGLKGVMLNLF